MPGEPCLLGGIHKLPQGHALDFDVAVRHARTWAYWSLPPSEPADATDEELLEELERLLADSVRLRLIADVPVGIMLSGGVDSSLVAAMAARVSSRRIKTFNISFPGPRHVRRGAVRARGRAAFRHRSRGARGRAGDRRSPAGARAAVRRADRRLVDGADVSRVETDSPRSDGRSRRRRRRRAVRRLLPAQLGAAAGVGSATGSRGRRSAPRGRPSPGCCRSARKGRNYLLGLTAEHPSTSCSSTWCSMPTRGGGCWRRSARRPTPALPKPTRPRCAAIVRRRCSRRPRSTSGPTWWTTS